VSAAQRDRLTTFYTPGDQAGKLRVLDRPDGWWAAPPKMPDASGGLVSTVDDLWADRRVRRHRHLTTAPDEPAQALPRDRGPGYF